MMKTKRIISLLLAVLMLLGSFVMIAAAEEDAPKYEFKTSPTKETYKYFTDTSITNAQMKLERMDLRLEQDGFRLYVDEYSGEVAFEDIASGEVLFTNPYDLSSAPTAPEKAKLISQFSITFKDPSTGSSTTYHSANKNLIAKGDNAAKGNDLNVSYIKNGIRVEYAVGTEEARMLLPVWLEKESFENLCKVMDENGFKKDVNKRGAMEYFMAFYFLRDPAKGNDSMYNNFPITKEGVAIYTLNDTSTKNKKILEGYIKTYAPDYTYEDMDEDHAKVKYEDDEIAPPLFKLALEYTVDEQGLSVTLPANGIRFDETHYQLENIEMLPYMGSGSATNAGYTFYPDGSGTLFDFEECSTYGKTVQVTGKVYGQDYAYHTISGTNQQIIRYPVYGLVETQNFAVLEDGKVVEADKVKDDDQEKVVDTYSKDRGYLAVIEEGASLVSLLLIHDTTTDVNTIKPVVSPRPKDSYNLGDSVSIAANKSYSVVSNRKYTGTYKIRYMMLTDPDVAAEKDLDNTYPCTYYGMAQAYREYLEKGDVLKQLTEKDISDAKNLPLYIEALGALETTEKFLSIPVQVMTPLTTFEDIRTMYDDLSDNDITNVNFILNGFTKGGLTMPATPYRLKWEKAVEEGGVDFEELVEYAKEKGFGVYPDVDFVFIHSNTLFDGLSLSKHAAKTIDNRYASLQEYDATKQTYVSYYDLLFSSAYMSKFYEKFTDSYLDQDPMGISVSTLGSYLSSDFDEDEPFNRDDSEYYTEKAFEYFDEKYDKVMTYGGNAYSWKYVDYITDVATDSSRYSRSSASVPFLGIVLHGYVELSGTSINMEGNLDYAMLKAIENGSALKFILAFRNTNNLKNDYILNKYYSIDYSVWGPDIIKLYNEINEVLGDVQTSKIVRHEFITDGVVRIPDADELERDAAAAVQAAIEAEKLANIAATETERNAILTARKLIVKYYDIVKSGSLDTMLKTEFTTKYNELLKTYNDTNAAIEALVDAALVTAYRDAEAALKAFGEEPDTTTDEYKAAEKALQDATYAIKDYLEADKERNQAYNNAKKTVEETVVAINALMAEEAYSFYDEFITTVRDFSDFYAKADEYKAVINASALHDDYKQELIEKLDEIVAASALYLDVEETKLAELETLYNTIKTDFADEFTVEPYAYIGKADVEQEVEKNTSDNKYAADKNKVVYEEFENGKALLLNFNNYDVTVKLGDVTYTLNAYDYLIVSEAK